MDELCKPEQVALIYDRIVFMWLLRAVQSRNVTTFPGSTPQPSPPPTVPRAYYASSKVPIPTRMREATKPPFAVQTAPLYFNYKQAQQSGTEQNHQVQLSMAKTAAQHRKRWIVIAHPTHQHQANHDVFKKNHQKNHDVFGFRRHRATVAHASWVGHWGRLIYAI